MSNKIEIPIGTVFGRLTVIREVEPIQFAEGKKRMFRVKCSCGEEKTVQINNLRSGNTKSCGKCVKKERSTIHPNEVNKHLLLGRYRYSAKLRGIAFELTEEYFYHLIGDKCFYCGVEPSNSWLYKAKNSRLSYNGIDRLDSTKGYIVGNVVTSCAICNRAKSNMIHQDFLEWVERVYDRSIKNGSPLVPLSIDGSAMGRKA